jgi:hypothetical protein
MLFIGGNAARVKWLPAEYAIDGGPANSLPIRLLPMHRLLSSCSGGCACIRASIIMRGRWTIVCFTQLYHRYKSC